MKVNGVLFHSMGHVSNCQYSKVFQPHCLIDELENLQSKGCYFNSESAETVQLPFPLNFEEYVHEKSIFKDPFMVENCIGFASFPSINFQPSFSQYVSEDLAGKYVSVKYLWRKKVFN